MTTVGALLAAHAGEARRDLEVLLGHLLEANRAWLYAHHEFELGAAMERRLAELLAQRGNGEPIAYLTGEKEFFGLAFEVNPHVLVPRPETELLVELTLARARTGARLLDVGTGCGAIAVALARSRADLDCTATDVDPLALEVARRNARRHAVDVGFVVADVFDAADDALAQHAFDLIVSNPPYVAAGDPHLAALAREPQRALIAGSDGLDILTRVIAGAPAHLTDSGWLLVEHGFAQGAAVRAGFRKARLRDVETVRDLAGHDRVTFGRR